MESYILLHNNFYQKHSGILLQNTKNLLEKLQIPFSGVEKVALEDKFLPNICPLDFYGGILKILLNAKKENKKILICDSQSLLIFSNFFKKLYVDVEFKDGFKKTLGDDGLNLLELEDSYVALFEVVFSALSRADFKKQRWRGFSCALMIDRWLESKFKNGLMLELASVSGLRILPFFKESYGYLLESNENLAYKMGALDYYEMVDCGVDFIATPNLANFALMDGCAKKLQNAAGRDDLEVPLLTLPQVILALFESSSAESLGFNLHAITPKML
ncbi:MAG: hypothetical protein PUB96_03005 [Helicobacteraceae bacterium]|nr:hypothetical protein [Helicobacteraceae bacterium]